MAATAHAMVNSLLECDMCCEVFNDPRILPCGHTFCCHCLQRLVNSNKGCDQDGADTMSCPVCRQTTALGSRGLQKFPRNFAVESMISALPSMNECSLYGDGDEHGKVEFVCVDCWDVLCANCSQVHKKHKLAKHHIVKPLSEVTMSDIQANKSKMNKFCTVHKNQEATMYCENCKCPSCIICASTRCKPHNLLDLTEADNSFIDQIKTTLSPLLDMQSKYEREVQDVSLEIETRTSESEKILSSIDTLLNKIEKDVKATLEQVLTHVRHCRATAKKTVETLTSEKLAMLQINLSEAKSKLQTIRQKVSDVEQHLMSPFTVFDRAIFVNQLPDKDITKNSTTQQKFTLADVKNVDLPADVSKWTESMLKWMENTTVIITTHVITTVPQLTAAHLLFKYR